MPDPIDDADPRTQTPLHRVGIPVADYAQQVGITPDAVLKRLHRGQLQGYKEQIGQREVWRVYPPAVVDLPAPPALPSDSALSAAYREAIAPYVERIEALSQRIGELETELRQTRRDLAAAQRTLLALMRREE